MCGCCGSRNHDCALRCRFEGNRSGAGNAKDTSRRIIDGCDPSRRGLAMAAGGGGGGGGAGGFVELQLAKHVTLKQRSGRHRACVAE